MICNICCLAFIFQSSHFLLALSFVHISCIVAERFTLNQTVCTVCRRFQDKSPSEKGLSCIIAHWIIDKFRNSGNVQDMKCKQSWQVLRNCMQSALDWNMVLKNQSGILHKSQDFQNYLPPKFWSLYHTSYSNQQHHPSGTLMCND